MSSPAPAAAATLQDQLPAAAAAPTPTVQAAAAAPTPTVHAAAHALTLEGYAAERRDGGELPPCRNIDPVDPPLTMAEYANMERDGAKYLLYMTAVASAVADIATSLRQHHPGDGQPHHFRAVIVGPGRGRLVRYVLDAAETSGIEVSVLCLEANQAATRLLARTFADDPRVTPINCVGPRLHPSPPHHHCGFLSLPVSGSVSDPAQLQCTSL